MLVNEKTGVRAHILDCLRNAVTPVSGEMIAESCGVSRVAVWKAIKTLNDSGYLITATPTGYLLETDQIDSVFPWEFSGAETGFKYLNETTSTMDMARSEAMGGCKDGLIVLADRQTDGRGTGNRKWQSFDGALCFTLVTRPPIEAGYAHRETLRAQLAMADAIASVSGQHAVPQWPNDLYLQTGKACGILAETLSTGNAISYLNLGIGVNTGGVNTGGVTTGGTSGTERIMAQRGTQSTQSTRSTQSGDALVEPAFVASGRQELLKAFRARYRELALYISETDDELARAWNASCPLVGKTVNWKGKDARVRTGAFSGVDAAGWAVIQDTAERHFPPGSITILDKGTPT